MIVKVTNLFIVWVYVVLDSKGQKMEEPVNTFKRSLAFIDPGG